MKYTNEQIEYFKAKTLEELILQDPEPVLRDLGIDYRDIGNDSYRMKVRSEKTPSAFISLRKGHWIYKDFGSGSGGNIVNVVMDATGKDYKDSLNYTLNVLGVKNYFNEADRERLRAKKEENINRSSSHQISKVTAVYDVNTNELAKEYLKSRGITKIPRHMKVIQGEYTNRKGETKRVFGVGVLTIDGSGADIHFLKKMGSLKTMSFGHKDISFFKNSNSKKVAIFESKMDYAAAYQQIPLDKVNVIIANATSNAKKVAELLKREGLNENVMFFNQNDHPGYEFVKKIVEEGNVKKFKTINYEITKEYKKDINDLLLDGDVIANRIGETTMQHLDMKIKIAEAHIKSLKSTQTKKDNLSKKRLCTVPNVGTLLSSQHQKQKNKNR